MLHLLFQVNVSTECACVPQTESPHRSPRRHQSDESSKHDWCNDYDSGAFDLGRRTPVVFEPVDQLAAQGATRVFRSEELAVCQGTRRVQPMASCQPDRHHQQCP
jgi:hypothetical protein